MDTLRVHRVRAGLTQLQLAQILRTDVKAVAQYERHERTPNGPMLQRLAKALGCSADDIDLSKPEKVSA